jgi:hypothetical protein
MKGTDKIRASVLRKIEGVSIDNLRKINEFLDSLENSKNSKERILSYAGQWKDIDPEVFDELTDKTEERRKSNPKD